MRLRRKPFLGQRKSSGLTLIELLIALSIGAVGMTAVISLFVVAIANNSRSHRDTAATLLSQSVLEQILLAGTNNVANIGLTDCLGNNFTINSAGGAAPGAGATVTASGDIDFSAAAPGNNYSMTYNICRANGQTSQYDVRWNVRDMSTSGTTVYTRLVRVSAKPVGTTAANSYLLPVTLRGTAAVAEN
ncbi:MAG TPA: prepilin-type N-terminal cleavage/methylation domain-containing protein [Terriglobales bacterium]|jgi:prepilin-type N-terminal cleavage/methylation domain-containing protein|nr:prepilin-type N-terminal cleavage/methylation domain-containing protein [Terriglobales bacterium]